MSIAKLNATTYSENKGTYPSVVRLNDTRAVLAYTGSGNDGFRICEYIASASTGKIFKIWLQSLSRQCSDLYYG